MNLGNNPSPAFAPTMPTDQDPGAPSHAANDLMTRAVQGAHDTLDRLAESATPKLAELEQGLADAGSALHDKAGALRATGDEWTESLRSSVREHPLAALTAALALGALIARIAR